MDIKIFKFYVKVYSYLKMSYKTKKEIYKFDILNLYLCILKYIKKKKSEFTLIY